MDKTKVAKHFNVEPDAVVKCRLVDGGANVRALIDYGIGGIKVFVVPVGEIDEPFEPEPEPIPEPEPEVLSVPEPLPVPAAIDLSYRDLQELARGSGIPANQSADELRAALLEIDEGEN